MAKARETNDLSARLAELEARADISEVLSRYCMALDTRDVDRLRSCFHPDSTHNHGGFVGPSLEFCNSAMALLAKLVKTQHLLGTISIEVTDGTATAQSYFHAYHRLPGEGEMVFPEAKPGEDVFICGRYLDRFERRDGTWLIAHRTGLLDWARFEPGDDRGFGDPRSAGLVPEGRDPQATQ